MRCRSPALTACPLASAGAATGAQRFLRLRPRRSLRRQAANEMIDDLFGQDATLSMTVTDDQGHSATANAEVVLVDNPVL